MLAIGVAAALLIPAASDLRAGAPLAAAVLVLASARFTVSAIAALAESSGALDAAAVLGLVVAAAAFYGASRSSSRTTPSRTRCCRPSGSGSRRRP
jgi:succinate-acetate transporter protein